MSREYTFKVNGYITISAHSHTEAAEELKALFEKPETEVEGWDSLVKNMKAEQTEWCKALKASRRKKKVVVPRAEEVPDGDN